MSLIKKMNRPSKEIITFVVKGDPKAQKRHRSGRGFHYDPSKADKSDFLLLAHSHIPSPQIEGPISFCIKYYMPIPKSWPKYRKEAAYQDDIPHIKTPDVDNLLKFNMDAMAPFWKDDRQIYRVTASKYYSHEPRTEVMIVYDAK